MTTVPSGRTWITTASDGIREDGAKAHIERREERRKESIGKETEKERNRDVLLTNVGFNFSYMGKF